jgi:putative DNA primase/helicase
MTRQDERCELLGLADLPALLVELTGVDSRGNSYPCPNRDHEQTGSTPPVTIAESNDGYQVWRCHACGIGGTAIDALMLARDVDAGAAIAELRARAGREQQPQRPKEKQKREAPLPSEDQLANWVQRLVDDRRLVERLHEVRGWTRDALAELGVGYDSERQRLVFSIRDGRGTLLNVCRYTPTPKDAERKMISLGGRPRALFPAPESLEGDEVWIVEGEPDAVAARSLGLLAVSIPGVEFAKRLDIEPLRRFQRVHVALDCDAQGRQAAAAIAQRLGDAGIEVRVLDLDPSRHDGYDLGDLVREAAQLAPDGLAQARKLLESTAADAPVSARLVRPGELRVVSAASIRVEQVQFLEPQRVPLGAVTLVVGDPGLGKSTWTCLLAARTTSGANGIPSSVLMANAEDSPAHVIVPRLAAAGADLSRVEFFTISTGDDEDRPFVLPEDVLRLEAYAKKCGARLVVLDPLAAFLADAVNTKSDHHVRRALAPLATMAQRLGIAVVVVAHLNKSAGTDPLYRVGGSIGLVGGARSLLLFARDPDDPEGEQGARRALGHVKSNWGQLADTLLYEHESTDATVRGTTVETHRLVVVGESGVDGRSLLGTDPDDPPASQQERALELLADVLGDRDWHRGSTVKDAAKRAGISHRTLQRAAKDAGIEYDERGFPKVTWWRLPQSRQGDGATVAPNGWRDCENPVTTGDSAPLDSRSRHVLVNGATALDAASIADFTDEDFLAIFPGSTIEHASHTADPLAVAATNGHVSASDLARAEEIVRERGGEL